MMQLLSDFTWVGGFPFLDKQYLRNVKYYGMFTRI